jgi:hypothetical protein
MMVRVFKEAGWPQATERFASGGTGNGFFIVVHDHLNAPAYAVSIQKAYKRIGIDMSGPAKPDIPEGAVQIFILVAFLGMIQAWQAIKSADAAKSAADTARDALHISERAYVVTGTATLDMAKKAVSIPILNSGHLPAKEVIITIHSALLEAVPPTRMDLTHWVEMSWDRGNRDSIVPEFPAPIDSILTKMSQQQMEADNRRS